MKVKFHQLSILCQLFRTNLFGLWDRIKLQVRIKAEETLGEDWRISKVTLAFHRKNRERKQCCDQKDQKATPANGPARSQQAANPTACGMLQAHTFSIRNTHLARVVHLHNRPQSSLLPLLFFWCLCSYLPAQEKCRIYNYGLKKWVDWDKV